MNVVKCSNGHFFDSDTYKVCPHCDAPAVPEEHKPVVEQREKSGGKSFFGILKKKKETSAPREQHAYNPPPVPERNTDGSAFDTAMPVRDDNGMGVPRQDNDPWANKIPAADYDYDKTLDFWQVEERANKKRQDQYMTEIPDRPEPEPEQVKEHSLYSTVKQASATADGKTMSYFSALEDKNAANPGPAAQAQSAPVGRPAELNVGWLVCIGGPHFGCVFNIYAGMNALGRSESNKIVLNADNAVSREKHSLISYEPKHKNFYIKPGDSSGLTYVNDEYVTENRMLHVNDIIEVGQTKLLFIPLCSDAFSWEKYIAAR